MAKKIIGEAYIDMKVDGQGFRGEVAKLGNDARKSFEERLGKVDLAKLKIKIDELNGYLKEAIRKGNKEAEIEIRAKITDVQEKMAKVRKEIKESQKESAGLTSSFSQIAKTIASLYVVQQGFSLAQHMAHLADQYEKADIAFTTMLGSAEAAKKLLSDLSNFAKNTPFEIGSIRDVAKQLLAMGVQSKDIIPTLKALGDVSAGLSIPMERLALAYGQVLSKGKLQGGELKQFTEAGVPLVATLSEKLGVTEAQFYKMMEAGQISSNDVIQAFQIMSSEGGKFANLMEHQANTFSGMWSNFLDTLTVVGEKLGTYLLPLLKENIYWINLLLDGEPNNSFEEQIRLSSEEMREINKVIQQLYADIDKIKKGFFDGSISAGEYSSKIKSLKDAISLQEKELAKLQNRQDMVNYLQGISSNIMGEYIGKSDEAEKTLASLNDQLSLNKEKFANGDISLSQYNETNDELLTRIKEINKEMQSYQGEVDDTTKFLDILANTTMSEAEAKEYLAAVKIANQSDIVALDNETKAALKMGSSYMEAYKAKKLVENAERRSKQLQIKTQGSFMFRLSQGQKTIDNIQADIEKNNEIIKIIDDFQNKQKKINLKLASGGLLTTPPKLPNHKGSGKSFQDPEKIAKEQAKKELETQKQLIQDKLALDIEAVNKSTLIQYEKAKRIVDISEEAQRKIQELEGKTSELAVKDAKELVKAHEEKTTKLKKYGEEIIKIGEKFSDMKKKVLDDIREINNEIATSETDHANALAQRFVEVEKSIEDFNKKIVKNASDFIGLDSEEYEELKKLEEERQLLISVTTEELREQAKAYDKLTESHKMIKTHEQELKILKEKKDIAEAFNRQTKLTDDKLTIDPDANKVFYENEKGEIIQITNLKNEEYARDLINKQVAMQQELALKQQEIVNFINEEEKLYSRKKELLKIFTNDVVKTTEEQKKSVTGLIDMFQKAIMSYKQYQSVMGGLPGGKRAHGGTIMPNLLYQFQENGLREYIMSPSYARIQPAPASHYKTQHITINQQNHMKSYNSGDEFAQYLQNNIGNYL